jgi:hypothetical protein
VESGLFKGLRRKKIKKFLHLELASQVVEKIPQGRSAFSFMYTPIASGCAAAAVLTTSRKYTRDFRFSQRFVGRN